MVFFIVLIGAVVLDLGLLNKKSKTMTVKKALWQTALWVGLALAFGVFIWLWKEDGKKLAVQYISAYLMEWSLSIDNIFVFILLFTFFRVKQAYYGRALLIGILMAIVFRVIFIAIGIALVTKFYWILYIFGAFLVFTGIKMFFANQEEEFKPQDNKVYKLIKKIFPITHHDAEGKYTLQINGKKHYTMLFVVVIMLATTDIVFALDSIPAVFAISQDKMVIYTSNIFAVLGLRSLFFLLKGAVNKFDYLQQGISIVLILIGIKMLIEYFHIHIETWVSLLVIVVCIGSSILYSLGHDKPGIPGSKKRTE